MLRKSAAFAPRYRKFESICLQRRVRANLKTTSLGCPSDAGPRVRNPSPSSGESGAKLTSSSSTGSARGRSVPYSGPARSRPSVFGTPVSTTGAGSSRRGSGVGHRPPLQSTQVNGCSGRIADLREFSGKRRDRADSRPSRPYPRNEEVRPIEMACDARTVSECRAFLARRCGVRSLRSSSGRKGRDGALKTDWTKPRHGGVSYGDRMAPVMVRRGSRAGEAEEGEQVAKAGPAGLSE